MSRKPVDGKTSSTAGHRELVSGGWWDPAKISFGCARYGVWVCCDVERCVSVVVGWCGCVGGYAKLLL